MVAHVKLVAPPLVISESESEIAELEALSDRLAEYAPPTNLSTRHLMDIRHAMHAIDAYVQLLMDLEGVAARCKDPALATVFRKLAAGER